MLVAQLVRSFIFFSACNKSHVKWADSQKPTINQHRCRRPSAACKDSKHKVNLELFHIPILFANVRGEKIVQAVLCLQCSLTTRFLNNTVYFGTLICFLFSEFSKKQRKQRTPCNLSFFSW